MQFQCCGITVRPSRGYELWKRENVHFRNELGPTVPESCCRSREDDPSRKACQGKQPRRDDTYFEVSGLFNNFSRDFETDDLYS